MRSDLCRESSRVSNITGSRILGGFVLSAYSIRELKSLIDRCSNKQPLELITQGLSSPAEIFETYKNFKIRKWSDHYCIRYDTSYK